MIALIVLSFEPFFVVQKCDSGFKLIPADI